MNTYRVKLYGVLAEIAERSELEISGCDESTIEAVTKEIVNTYPAMKLVQYQVAVNRRVQRSGLISEEDELVLLPPFAGG